MSRTAAIDTTTREERNMTTATKAPSKYEKVHPDAMTRVEILDAISDELRKHGLFGEQSGGWHGELNERARTIYGSANYVLRKIEISWPIARLNPREETMDTIRHEVAHALAGRGAGHGPRWKAACAITGARPTACYDGDDVATPWKYGVVCDGCGQKVGERSRRTKRRYFHFADKCLPELRDSDKREQRVLRWIPREELPAEWQ